MRVKLCVLVLVSCSLSRVAEAQSGTTQMVRVLATGVCLGQVDLETRVRAATRQPLAGSLRVVIEGQSNGRLTISIWRGQARIATRPFSAETADCEAFADALALSIAVGLDAVFVPEPVRAAPDLRRRVLPGAPKPVPTLRLFAGAGLVSGVDERLALAPRLALAWRLSAAAALQLGCDAGLPARRKLDSGQAVTQLLSAHGRLCYRSRDASLSVQGCGGLDVGAIYSRGEGFDVQDSGWGVWAAAGGGPTVEYSSAFGLGLLVSLDGLWAFSRPTLKAVDASGQSVAEMRLPPFVWRLALGATYPLF